MRRFVLAAVLVGLAWEANAQGASGGKPLELTVRPSDYEAGRNDAIERQQKLLKRLEQSDHMVRSICINCGDDWKHQIYAPFDPYASLRGSRPPTEATAN